MKFLHAIASRVYRQDSQREALTPRLLEDVGIACRQPRSIVHAIFAAFVPSFTAERLWQRSPTSDDRPY